ncbi:MAG: bifunctional diaminohydroxyphosphoribosylaminopyrimidine deaminase/5-amino-6-(5-phosphoribosylamino)uracil reductase RibD [Gammaproteobacteria bacterium]|jgi:diaminohydroxyphosphoribosylaminopyrimidine deaminase/5-amino-6-(5-phosphoribosylamino)uracil reductase|nr:bifunctional diaminohydroxyphosphoribosylaminopyrimidine deaminase/5-amino-6-(5-phosphoribosylamino)uracil reductase RibD [Gammaproteobacteria bacterium]
MSRPLQYWMAEALRQARKGLYSTPPNPCVGCVIVSDDVMLASGWHGYSGGPHAEVNALLAAEIPAGADIYITLEPCSHHGKTPPCVDALIEAKPARVIVAMQDPNPQVSGRGLERLRAQGIDVVVGVLEAQARELNRGFIKRMEQGLPFVSLKMALSLDGRSALKNGSSHWITSAPARRDVQFLRARAGAILTSAQTVLDDDPSLNLRLSKQELKQIFEVRQPVRVVLDSRLRLSGSEKLFTIPGDIWIYSLSEDVQRKERLEARGATVISITSDESERLDLRAMLQDLAQRGINDVHSECGQRLAGALIQQQLADQLVLYLAPHLLGSAARGGFDLGELTAMEQRKTCSMRDMRQLGDDLRLTLSID